MRRTPALPALLALLALAPIAASQDEEPAEERGLRVRTDAATPGYTLFSPLALKRTVLLDLDGEVVHDWTHDYNPGSMVYLRDNGNLVRCGHEAGTGTFNGGGMGGIFQEFTWEGELVWQLDLNMNDFHQHHDVELLPNGNVLVIGWELKTREEAIARGRDPHAVGEKGLWPDVVREIRPTPPTGGEVVWEWHAWDHLIQDFDEALPSYGSIPDHPGRLDINGDHRDRPPVSQAERERLRELEEQMRQLGYAGDDEEEPAEDPSEEDLRRLRSPDWMHTNGVAYLPELDLIALSSPEFNEILVIDHSTTTAQAATSRGGRYGKGGDFLWRWGNPRNYGAGKNRDRKLFYQHDPTWQVAEDGAVSLLLFNNGGGRPGGDASQVLELALPFDRQAGFTRAAGGAFGPEAPAWSYEAGADFFAAFISGAQRLQSGNTLICSGTGGRLFEVTPGGEIVWELLNDLGGESQFSDNHPPVPPHAVFRAHRYAPDHPALKGRL